MFLLLHKNLDSAIWVQDGSRQANESFTPVHSGALLCDKRQTWWGCKGRIRPRSRDESPFYAGRNSPSERDWPARIHPLFVADTFKIQPLSPLIPHGEPWRSLSSLFFGAGHEPKQKKTTRTSRRRYLKRWYRRALFSFRLCSPLCISARHRTERTCGLPFLRQVCKFPFWPRRTSSPLPLNHGHHTQKGG